VSDQEMVSVIGSDNDEELSVRHVVVNRFWEVSFWEVSFTLEK
jgi:hypothetical protein